MATIVISGASGLVGSALCEHMEARGDRVQRLVRREVRDPDREIFWKPSEGRLDAPRLEGVDAVVHLAGENIAGGRWTEAFKRRVIDSRIASTRLIAEAVAKASDKPATLVTASAIGFYGNRPDEVVDETSAAGEGFLAETCIAWEEAGRAAWEAGVRVAQTRIGIVLSPDGGALEKLLTPFKLGVGGRMGSGRQMMSWISLPDLVRALVFVIDTPTLHGAVNATAPGAVSNAEFSRVLAKVLNRCACLPAPALALRLLLGQMADEMLLGGAQVAPKRLLEAGFRFETPDLEAALRAVLNR